MSDKVIIVTDMPESCSKCKFMYEFYGVKKCQLLNVLKNGGKAIICVDKLNVARKECCPLVSAEEHDKEIRDKAIEEALENAAKAICIGCGYLDGCKCTYEGANCNVSKPMLERITEALEQLKEE